MSITSKYIVTRSSGGNFIDFNLNAGSLVFDGQEWSYAGSSDVDSIFVRPGVTIDFTSSKGSQDKIYFDGNWADYINSISLDKITTVMYFEPGCWRLF